MINVSAEFVAIVFKNLFTEIYNKIDVLFANEKEIHVLGTELGFKFSDLQDLAVQMANHQQKSRSKINPLTVVITQGAEDTIVAQTGDKKAKLFPIEKIEKNLIKDCNGAGDSYVGGFVAGMMVRQRTEISAKLGALTAKHVIQQIGATYAEPSKDELDRFNAIKKMFAVKGREYLRTGRKVGLWICVSLLALGFVGVAVYFVKRR